MIWAARAARGRARVDIPLEGSHMKHIEPWPSWRCGGRELRSLSRAFASVSLVGASDQTKPLTWLTHRAAVAGRDRSS